MASCSHAFLMRCGDRGALRDDTKNGCEGDYGGPRYDLKLQFYYLIDERPSQLIYATYVYTAVCRLERDSNR